MCSDQEAVDLIRGTHDPQAASKALVDHALARFSTDNLSCMVIRFDSKAVQQTVESRVEPIGVEGDAASKQGGVTEAEAIVSEHAKRLDESGELADKGIPPDQLLDEHEAGEAHGEEAGPELSAEAVQAARKDNKPTPDQPQG